ncbi:MAG: hypothetical protein IPG07_19120 [Crocinitomicaceae bacterium]|nr:hypothetical protein [Crocinitomicaceae bacterium]
MPSEKHLPKAAKKFFLSLRIMTGIKRKKGEANSITNIGKPGEKIKAAKIATLKT